MNGLSPSGQERGPMSGLTPTILLIVTFLVLTLAVRMAGRRSRPTPTATREDHPDTRT